MATAKDLAIETVKVSVMSTLRLAVIEGTISDVIGVHSSVLRARLGAWDGETERDAVSYLREAVEAAIESSDFQDDDDAEIEESDLIERIAAAL